MNDAVLSTRDTKWFKSVIRSNGTMGLIKINDMIISTTTNVYVLLSSKKQSTLFIEKSRAGFSKNEL